VANVNPLTTIKTRSLIVFVIVLIASFILAASSYHILTLAQASTAISTPATVVNSTPTASTPGTAGYPPPVPPSSVLGILADTANPYQDIPWVRLSYDTCYADKVQGSDLKAAVAQFHRQGVRVMLSLCQWANDSRLYDMTIMNDAAQGGADAVQCGNEQMKSGAFNEYVPPAIFARFFDLCTQAMHAVRPEIPIILGALDPHVGGVDYQPLVDQVNYLNQMQTAMNTQVHPGGNWNWRNQTVGLIDSWHNGYPNQYTDSLYWLFVFWSQQFHVDLNNGSLGHHLWVIEGTGCIYGCGIDTSSPSAVAISHILTLITDVQTTLHYKVPFFYFSGRDFYSQGQFWPMGVRDSNDQPKPLRQDLPMGARTLTLSCASGKVTVQSQEQLLASLYSGCTLPSDYISILTS
jgi:hypothetical protein